MHKPHVFRWLLPLPLSRQLLPIVAVVALYALAVYQSALWLDLDPHKWGTSSSVASGIILGLLLVVHTNTANARWWEGRTLWGQLINHSRNLSLKVRELVAISAAERRQVGHYITGFAHALRLHLREGVRLKDVPEFSEEQASPPHVPLFLAQRIYEVIAKWRARDIIDSNLIRVLDEHARALMDVCGACEKIRFTPLPLSFRALLRHGIVIYLLITPFYIVRELGLLGVPTIAVVAYFLVGTELLAEDVEEPFGIGPDNLDLDAFCRTIETSVREVLG